MTQKTFENDHIAIEVERHPGCKVHFSLKTKPLATKAAHAAAIKNVSKELNIPGFRKGHAPTHLITSQFKPHVDKEFQDILSRNSINEAMKLSKIHPATAKTSVKLLKWEPLPEDTYHISFEFEAFPDVPSIDPKTLDVVPLEPKAVNDSEIEKRIHELQLHHATWEEVTTRPAADGDFVILDIDNLDVEPHSVHVDSKFQLLDGKMPAWARKIVIGLNVGESKEGQSEQEDEKEFTPHNYKFTLKKIEQPILPERDDALAKKAGVESFDKLGDAIRKSLEKEEVNAARQKTRAALKEAIFAKYDFEVPAEEIKSLHDRCHEIADEDDKLSHDEKHAYAHQLLEQSQKNIRLSYLLPKVYQDHQLSRPTESDIQRRATEMMMMHYMSGRTDITSEDLQQMTKIAEDQLYTEKALDFLLDKGTS